ncbi:electron transfer flavoprotein subunit alpha [Enorma burkinafasonensis]|uniref:electron transfer flavoprotein subunit alpha n=1 Tax=Enorma burkinafasonensis TaxID=2590867 RepID=UPI0011A4CF29|nr:electron transfer flavoprotein subunit alpha [Enorma burkinafasonensis]
MSGLAVDTERCVGCARCVRACAFGGIEVRDRLARPTDACTLCGACVEACPTAALAVGRDVAGAAPGRLDAQGLAGFRDIWVVAQRDAAGAVLPVTFELVAKARELAAARGCRVVAVLAEGAQGPSCAKALLAAGADAVLRCRDGRLAEQDAEVLASLLVALARDRRPEVVLFGATALGREVAPRAAVQLASGLTADCTALSIDPVTDLLQQTRPAFGGNLMATIECPAHRPQMATVRPGVFAGPHDAGTPRGAAPASGPVEDVVLDAAVAPRVRVIERVAAAGGPSIAQAKRLVVVGRGIGGKKNLPLMEHLAYLLGAELGCTRPLVEAGWLDYAHQVGQTGVAVAPELMLSLGVSGAVQHLAGIGGARTVIAVNEDPSAPIFGAARYRVVADCMELTRELVRRLEARR